MRSSISIIVSALVAASSVAAHGKMAVMTGDLGGNGTALGIMGGVVPGPGKNSVTETDTTVFKGKSADSCGKTKANGVNTMDAGLKMAMAQSGDMLPQVSPAGMVMGTVHVVTSDGFGPYTALIDPTGTGDFSNVTKMNVVQQVPGDKRGNGKKTTTKRFEEILKRFGIMARATNINEDFPIKAEIPAGTMCTGVVNGQTNVCMVKFVNPSKAGPFGGCVAIQMPAAAAGAAPAAAGAAAPAVGAGMAMPASRKFRKVRM